MNRGLKAFVPFDIIIYLAIIAMMVGIFYSPPRESGHYVQIWVGNNLYAIVDLNKDSDPITVTQGRRTNIIRVSDGLAYFSFANCPTRKCVRDGKTGTLGDARICAEANVRFKIVGQDGNIYIPPSTG